LPVPALVPERALRVPRRRVWLLLAALSGSVLVLP